MGRRMKVATTIVGLVALLVLVPHGDSRLGKRESEPIYHNTIAVQLEPGCDPDQLADRHGLVNEGQIGSLEDHYVMRDKRLAKRSVDPYPLDNLQNDPDVRWCQQQQILEREKKEFIPSDPLYPEMWYLNEGASEGYDMNVENVWNMGITGKGVVIGIIDDGVQIDHPDLERNIDRDACRDVVEGDYDPTPHLNSESHGTSCAGIVGAVNNDICGIGIAFNASIGGIRLLDSDQTDATEANALTFNWHHIDIFSSSWGPVDAGAGVDKPGELVNKALEKGITQGRNGLGNIYVWAAGNGGSANDYCSVDGYSSSRYTISISPVSQSNTPPWYLERCAAIVAATYSSGKTGRDQAMVTTRVDLDYKERHGNDSNLIAASSTGGICTVSFTGTSAATPIASGIIALALEANPKLTWRDVQYLMVITSRYKPLYKDDGWFGPNGAGRMYSHRFGYGLMDAEAMVRVAQSWKGLPPVRSCTTGKVPEPFSLPLLGSRNFTIDTVACHNSDHHIKHLEHVEAVITAKNNPRGNLAIYLISPAQTQSILLLPRPKDVDGDSFENWVFLSVHFFGENPAGTWTLRIQVNDTVEQKEQGQLIDWKLNFYGTYEEPYNKKVLERALSFRKDKTPGPSAKELEENLAECQKKDQYYDAKANKCVDKCKPEQYQMEGMCYACHDSCRTCTGVGNDECDSCPDERYYYGGRCVITCVDGYYADEKKGECLPCDETCPTCINSATECLSCNEGTTLSDRHCVPDCQEKNGCGCAKDCYECTGPDDGECLTCAKGYRRFSGGSCEDAACPDGSYEFKDEDGHAACSACHYSCETCTGPAHSDCK